MRFNSIASLISAVLTLLIAFTFHELAHAVGPSGAVTGVDVSTAMLRRAGAAAPRAGAARPSYVIGDALRLPLADGSVDAATIAFGLRNVADRRGALAEMARVVRPNRHVFIGVPYRTGPLAFQPAIAGTSLGQWIGRTFSGHTLAHVMQRAGLEPIRLQAKEGLSLVNGTQFMAAAGALALVRAHRLAKTADLACGLSVGIINGLGVALLSVSPFIMTLGMASVGFCAALAFCSLAFKLIPNYWYANILSLMNLLCGVVGCWVVLTGRPPAYALGLVFLGQFLDLFDGRAAERWGSTPQGEVFDDVADGTSFGLTIGLVTATSFAHLWVGVAVGGLYLAAVAYRLVRFVVEKRKAGIAEPAAPEAGRELPKAFPSWPSLSTQNVVFLRDRAAPPPPLEGRTDVFLGIDIGSVSTNFVLLDRDGNLLKEIYVGTQGRPVQVVTDGLRDLLDPRMRGSR